MKKTVLFLLLSMSASAFSQAWSTIVAEGVCSLEIPPTLEFRGKSSFHGSMIDSLAKVFHIANVAKDRLVICPKGYESMDDMAMRLYARIIIWVEKEGDKRRYLSIEKWTQEEKSLLNVELPSLLKEQVKGTDVKIVSVSNVDYPLVGHRKCMHYTYRRKSSNAQKQSSEYDVIVDVYRFFNGESAIEMNFSYRKCESHLWKNDFKKIIGSISFTNKIK
jgi:hypothetical protein